MQSSQISNTLANTIAIDLETECTVVSCKHFGRSICEEGHSLSPWHSRITVIGVYGYVKGVEIKKVFREVAAFDSFINSLDPLVTYIFHNGPFDIKFLHANGINLDLAKWSGDSLLAAHTLTEKISDDWLANYELERQNHKGQRKGGKHSLKTLAPYFLGVPMFWEKEDHDNDEYVLKDCEYTYRLLALLEEKLKERGEYQFYKEKVLEWAKLTIRMTARGIMLDVNGVLELQTKLQKESDELKQKLDEVWHDAHVAYTETLIMDCNARYAQMAQSRGQFLWESERYSKLHKSALAKITPGVSIDSPTQLLWLLRDYYGYDCTSLEGKDGTGKEILQRLAAEGKEDVAILLNYRKVQKILTTYIPDLLGRQVGNIIRPVFAIHGTDTGRLSSSGPNAQNLHPSIKRLFRARPTYTFVGMDLGGIEAKLLALFSGDRALYDIVAGEQSIHSYNTRIFFDLEEDVALEQIPELYPKERKAAKTTAFSLFYGAGPKRLQAAFTQAGFKFSDYECKQMYNKFRQAYSRAFEFADEVRSEMESGQVIPNLLGRPIKIQNPEDVYLKAFNYLIQSSASDLNLEAAHRAQKEYDEKKIDAHVLALVHDFILVEAHDSIVDQAEEILKRHMTGFKLENEHGPVKLTVDSFKGKTWEK